MTKQRRQTGFTLVELMIGLLIGLLLMAGVITLLTQTSASARQNELIAGMQDNARFALSILANDIRAAGFTGGILNPEEIITSDTTLGSITNDCGTSSQSGWAYNTTTYGGPVQSISEKSASEAVAVHKCLPISKLSSSNEVLAIKRTLGEPKSGGLSEKNVYLRSNGETGCLWYYDGSSSPTATGCPSGTTEDWVYLARVYYIRQEGDVPSLCRYTLEGSSSGPVMTPQCLAEGIEQFHIEWGIDTDADSDGVANAYEKNPLDMSRVVSARIYVLSRSIDALPGRPASSKEFRLGSVTPLTTDDRFYRRVYSTTVLLRNSVNRANLL